MVTERCRAPVGVRACLSVAYRNDATISADLFNAGNVGIEPHPDFAARAAIWRDQRSGLISLAEAQRRSALVGQVKPDVAPRRNAPPRPRHSRPAPNDSRQYAAPMATTSARDDRLTPNAKALLQVLRARAGKGTSTMTTKFTLAAVMSRSARTVARYLRDLERFGYVSTEIRRNSRGLHLGLVVTLCEKVMPFFEEAKGLAAWLAETPKALSFAFTGHVLGFPRVTNLSPKNQPNKFPSYWKRYTAMSPREGRNPIPV
jgi:hypothetical protein